MLPGVELARRRRVHYHGDTASSSAASAGAAEYHHYHYAHAHRHVGAAADAAVVGPVMAARIRLEEKLRGAALPSSTATSPSRWSRLMGEREGRRASATSSGRRGRREQQHQQQHHAGRGIPATAAADDAAAEVWPPPPPPPALTTSAASTGGRRLAELTRTLSKVEVCAVCLDEVRERRQRVTRLPCSHKYHSECVLPWLAIQPDCPCCRALVPAADALA